MILRVIAIANQKGGCGKTTTSINLSACLSHLAKRVLLIDLDPQGHSTCGLGLAPEQFEFTGYDFLRGSAAEKKKFQKISADAGDFLRVLPSSPALARLEEEMAFTPGRERRLKEMLNALRESGEQFDYVLIDCPPNIGTLTLNALFAADELIVPIEPSFFSLHGLAKISETMETINRQRRSPLAVHALLTLFDSRTCFAKEVYEEVSRHFQKKLFRSIIHESVTLKECAGAGKSVVDFAPQSQACRDYMNLALEYLEKSWEALNPEDSLGWENVIRQRFEPRKAVGGVLFQCAGEGAQEVEIAGDFNSWVPEPLVRRREAGIWQKIIPMPAGEFRYKFIVDGEWQLDPFQENSKQNSFGSFDSWIKVN